MTSWTSASPAHPPPSPADHRRGTRAGSVGIYSTQEAVQDSGLDWENVDKSRVGIYVGVTEHGNVETENEIFELQGYDYDTSFWSHHHNPRTVANNPAGEVALNMGVIGPHYTIGAACAAGNAGLIQGVQMLRLQECDVALSGGVSESIHTFGIFASFKSQGALAEHTDPTKAYFHGAVFDFGFGLSNIRIVWIQIIAGVVDLYDFRQYGKS